MISDDAAGVDDAFVAPAEAFGLLAPLRGVDTVAASDVPAAGVDGAFDVPLAAFKFAHGGPSIETPPREMGADNEAVLGELGYAAGEIAALREAGAI